MFFGGGGTVGGERSFRVWALGHGPHSKEEGEGRRRRGDCLIFPAEEVEASGHCKSEDISGPLQVPGCWEQTWFLTGLPSGAEAEGGASWASVEQDLLPRLGCRGWGQALPSAASSLLPRLWAQS